MKKKLHAFLLLMLVQALLPALVLGSGKVGIVHLEAPYPGAEGWQSVLEAFGFGSELIKEQDFADADTLNAFRCIVLGRSYNRLYEKEYEALAGYVRQGGTLFLTDIAAIWMALDPDDRLDGELERINGAGPLEDVTGVRIGDLGGLVKGFHVISDHCFTQGLPEEFAYTFDPPYDIDDPASTRRTESTQLIPGSAEVLIKSEAFYSSRNPETGEREYDMEAPKKAAFLTVNSYGDGRAVWLACRARHLISNRNEQHIMRIVYNILQCSLKDAEDENQ